MKKVTNPVICRVMAIIAIVLCLTAGTFTEGMAAGVMLNDISGHWARDNISRLVALGCINGYPDGTFRPDTRITRAEFVKALITALGGDETQESAFVDTGNHWSEAYIKAALVRGIIELPDYYNNRFQPDAIITRGEMAKMVALGMGKKKSAGEMGAGDMKFKDGNGIPAKLAGYVAVATKEGIITGYPDNTFRSDGEATRAEAVAMIVRMLDWLEDNDGGTGGENSNNDENTGSGIDLDNIVESPMGDDGKRYGSDLKVIDKPFMIEILDGKLWHDGDKDENGNVIDIGYDYGYNIRAKYLMLEFRVTNITKETRDFRPIFWIWQTYGVETPIGKPGKVYTMAPSSYEYLKEKDWLGPTTLKPGESYTGKLVFQFMAEEVTSAIFQADTKTYDDGEYMDCFIPLPEKWWKD
ncbi:MAG: hypothetical protein HPY70_12825 [Firmicutes bacterium]|nr:hypothetical protein [Bacillota bacterium]